MPRLEEFTAWRYQIGTDPNTGDPIYRTFDDKASAIRSIQRHQTTSAKKEQEFQQWLREKMEAEGVESVEALARPRRASNGSSKDVQDVQEDLEEGEYEDIEEAPRRAPARKQTARR